MHSIELPDLEVDECIPTCQNCPGIWVNEVINHRIICLCCKNGHSKNNKK